ncbi:hypothetical protein J4429_01575 [Candidatus Pacearchaeota archaeon]|nr:hypothetical protein [Candidatus Pacearchaeota archaeon]
MENIGSVTYRPDLNQVYLKTRRTIRFFEHFNPEKIQKFIKLVLSEITPVRDLEDIHLEAFLATQERIKQFKEDSPTCLGILVYPKSGGIKNFQLNSETEFFSDAHQNTDPLTIIKLKYGLHVHGIRTEDCIQYSYVDSSIPNRITGGLFFKRNPFKCPSKYQGFLRFTRLNLHKPYGF